METLLQLDKELLIWFNSSHSPFWDVIMMFFTRIEFWIPFFILVAYHIFKYKGKEAWWWLIGLSLLILFGDLISTYLFKNILQRLRPSHEPALSGIVHLVKAYAGDKFGFVSSHATAVFAFAIYTSRLFRNNIYAIFITIWSLIIVYTRLYLGLHYPCDILGGMALGLGVGFFFYRITRWWVSRLYPQKQFARFKQVLSNSDAGVLIAVVVLEMMTITFVILKLLKLGFF
ncbi:phosphatase PAP2 family protein [Ancylomarina sp. 16SWW S1-10-2]|uniref:phosphatase PAP2 family protein n=1 Tax=Ancylomarina sp. 16SWW S1-10-2 TaxID=2499681 RepID=UPI0012ADE4C0|nr:phosphatase PAP2 family protein [Ancylomarina sp. 16SWW S1-10-2]MRT91584.1 phosphatase PAP2 family protein [Ancylomarina sp. 16SWW S1-10-2]